METPWESISWQGLCKTYVYKGTKRNLFCSKFMYLPLGESDIYLVYGIYTVTLQTIFFW